MILKSCVFASEENYFIETGLCIELNFLPIIRVIALQINSDKTLNTWIINTNEWFILMKKESHLIINFFNKSTETINETSNEDLKIGKYRLHLDFENNQILVYEAQYNVQPSVLTRNLFYELMRYYDVLTSHLEALNKYHFFAKFAFSQVVNFLMKKNIKFLNNKNSLMSLLAEVDLWKMTLLPDDSRSISNTALDIVMCKLICAEIKTLASEMIYKQVSLMKKYYSSGWNSDEYFINF